MRNDVLALSKEEGGEYTEELVQKQMQHVLSVGFTKTSVRLAMRPLLKTPNVSDDDIFQALKEIVMSEAEHDAKMESNVHTALTPVPASTRASATATTASTAAVVSELSFNKTEKLLEELETISQTLNQLVTLPSEVKELKKELYHLQHQEPYIYQQQHQQQPFTQMQSSNMNVGNVTATGGVYGADGVGCMGSGGGNGLSRGGGNSGNGFGRGGRGGGNGLGRGGRGGGNNLGRGGGNGVAQNGVGRGGAVNGVGRGGTGAGAAVTGRGGGRGGNQGGGGRQFTVTMRKCQNCDQEGPGTFWDHCFYCCGSGHKISDCPSKNEEGEHL